MNICCKSVYFRTMLYVCLSNRPMFQEELDRFVLSTKFPRNLLYIIHLYFIVLCFLFFVLYFLHSYFAFLFIRTFYYFRGFLVYSYFIIVEFFFVHSYFVNSSLFSPVGCIVYIYTKCNVQYVYKLRAHSLYFNLYTYFVYSPFILICIQTSCTLPLF